MFALIRIRSGDGRSALSALAIWAAGCLLLALLLVARVSGQDTFAIDTYDAYNSMFTCSSMRAGDQVWLVNSRELAHRACPADSLKIYQACGAEWYQSNLDTLAWGQTDKVHRETIIFVHGHRTDLKYAQVRGWQAYQALIGGNPRAPAVRFVIWAWPSETEHQHHLQSLHKSDLHGFFLARFLFRLDPTARVRLIGYSLGSRVVLGALHLANGGLIDGNGIAECGSRQLSPYRVTLVAPAINCDCLEMCASHYRACASIERLQIIYNSLDPVMRLYRLADRDHHQPALGRAGIPCGAQCGNQICIQQVDARQFIGRKHSIVFYWQYPCLIQQIGCHLFSDSL